MGQAANLFQLGCLLWWKRARERCKETERERGQSEGELT